MGLKQFVDYTMIFSNVHKKHQFATLFNVEEITQPMVETISGVPLAMPNQDKSIYSKRQAVNHALADALVDQELVN